MAIRKIRTVPDEMLTKVCREVTAFDERLAVLLDDLYETMKDANGVGLAAPQVGVLRRVAVIDVGEGRVELVNPVIIARSAKKQVSEEGCLSLPGKFGKVERPKSVTVRAQDRTGNVFELAGSEYLARAICHETDHLDGKVFVERVLK